MPKSMTGFGSAHGHMGSANFSVELRSVNHRSVKIQARLCDRLRPLVHRFEEVIRSRLQRGSVTCRIEMDISRESFIDSVDVDMLMKYVDKFSPLLENRNLVMDVASLVGLPGVVEDRKFATVDDEVADGIVKLVEDALDELVSMRKLEGRQITEELRELWSRIKESLAFIEKRADGSVERYNEKLRRRITQLSGVNEIRIDEDFLAREVAAIAEKSDISEEVSRLNSHLCQFSETLDGDGSVGRKLDFLAQEMLREANTMASKTQDGQVSSAVVDIKTMIDRMKEQAANLE